MNQVREVEVDGRSRVARISRRSAADLDWEIHLLGHLRAAGLPVPHLAPTADGRLRAGLMVVMERVEGAQPEGENDWRRVAAYLRELHQVTAGWMTQRPGWRSCGNLVAETRSGPVDLTVLPPDVLARCRTAWSRLPRGIEAVVHGDPNPTNIRVHGDTVVLLDWDESRVDDPLLDFVYVPDAASGLTADEQQVGRQAFYAWETAMFWTISPEHAHRRLAKID
jgi:Ser/Thr protein kinase RdoA (MazF antagonist)